jgi:hypothetical protein
MMAVCHMFAGSSIICGHGHCKLKLTVLRMRMDRDRYAAIKPGVACGARFLIGISFSLEW